MVAIVAIVDMGFIDTILVEVTLASLVEDEVEEKHVVVEEAAAIISWTLKKPTKEGRFSEQRQKLENNGVSLHFEAGRLKYYSHEWEKITADSNILDIVKHCKIEFIDNVQPCQSKAPFQNIFNEKENEVIDNEIQNLLKLVQL